MPDARPGPGPGHLGRNPTSWVRASTLTSSARRKLSPSAVDPAGGPQRQRRPRLAARLLEQRPHVGEAGGSVLECHEDLPARPDRLSHGRRRFDVDGPHPAVASSVKPDVEVSTRRFGLSSSAAPPSPTARRRLGPRRRRPLPLPVGSTRARGRPWRSRAAGRATLALVGHALDDRGSTGDLAAGLDRSGARRGSAVAGRGPLPAFTSRSRTADRRFTAPTAARNVSGAASPGVGRPRGQGRRSLVTTTWPALSTAATPTGSCSSTVWKSCRLSVSRRCTRRAPRRRAAPSNDIRNRRPSATRDRSNRHRSGAKSSSRGGRRR